MHVARGLKLIKTTMQDKRVHWTLGATRSEGLAFITDYLINSLSIAAALLPVEDTKSSMDTFVHSEHM